MAESALTTGGAGDRRGIRPYRTQPRECCANSWLTSKTPQKTPRVARKVAEVLHGIDEHRADVPTVANGVDEPSLMTNRPPAPVFVGELLRRFLEELRTLNEREKRSMGVNPLPLGLPRRGSIPFGFERPILPCGRQVLEPRRRQSARDLKCHL